MTLKWMFCSLNITSISFNMYITYLSVMMMLILDSGGHYVHLSYVSCALNLCHSFNFNELRIIHIYWFLTCYLLHLLIGLFVSSFLCVQSTDPADKDAWKDKGTGQLSIKCKEGIDKGTKESRPTIVVRNDVCFLSWHIFWVLNLRVSRAKWRFEIYIFLYCILFKFLNAMFK